MGKTRVTVRTLPNGDQVTHYPPDDDHPEGRMVLIAPETSAIAASLEERRDAQEEAIRDLRTFHNAKVKAKKDAEAADPAVPPEKRFI
jgi:hypothetical protein